MLQDLTIALEKIAKTGNENQMTIDALQKKIDSMYVELKEKIKQVEDNNVAGKTKFEIEMNELNNSFQYLMSELQDICNFIAQRQEEESQEDCKKRKGKEG